MIPLKTTLTSLLLITSTLMLTACGGSSSNPSNNDDAETPELNIVETAINAGSFETLVAALQATGLDSTLSDESTMFTVFAPTDDAFALLGTDTINALLSDTDSLSNILLYHVISGSEVDAATAVNSAGSTVETANGQKIALSLDGEDLLINFSMVTTTDIVTNNGIIHVIDAVLIPPVVEETPTMNIVEAAVANGNFSTLVTALQAAGLDETLSNEDETFTVFAPTDAAFALIDSAVLTELLADIPTLTNVLLQHVIIGTAVDSVTALSLNGTSVNTAADEDLTIQIVDGMLQIQGANVIISDVYTTNGIIHVIDAVITETLE